MVKSSEVKLEETKELKGGSDYQVGMGIFLEPCFENMFTLYLSAVYIVSLQQNIIKGMKINGGLCGITGPRRMESKSLKST